MLARAAGIFLTRYALACRVVAVGRVTYLVLDRFGPTTQAPHVNRFDASSGLPAKGSSKCCSQEFRQVPRPNTLRRTPLVFRLCSTRDLHWQIAIAQSAMIEIKDQPV